MTYELPFAKGYRSNKLAKAITNPDVHTADSVPGQAIRNGSFVYHLSFPTMHRLAARAVCKLDRNSLLSVGSDKNGRLTSKMR